MKLIYLFVTLLVLSSYSNDQELNPEFFEKDSVYFAIDFTKKEPS